MPFRIGFGYDIHPVVAGRELVLGGVNIPFRKGLDGDSDADVITHAIIDALLGAMGAGDIGRKFGVSKPELMGISSLKLLEQVEQQMQEAKYRVVNIDVTVIAEKPKLNKHILQMQKRLGSVLHPAELNEINIKATTAKRIGNLGAGKAIAAYAVVLLEKHKKT